MFVGMCLLKLRVKLYKGLLAKTRARLCSVFLLNQELARTAGERIKQTIYSWSPSYVNIYFHVGPIGTVGWSCGSVTLVISA